MVDAWTIAIRFRIPIHSPPSVVSQNGSLHLTPKCSTTRMGFVSNLRDPHLYFPNCPILIQIAGYIPYHHHHRHHHHHHNDHHHHHHHHHHLTIVLPFYHHFPRAFLRHFSHRRPGVAMAGIGMKRIHGQQKSVPQQWSASVWLHKSKDPFMVV